ncbi:Uu.00g113610.m01.CDS01 [Anthostomella pinea]|uniref:Uu.00g113610.m01.CDS01 n=1 Tax=Anthostomella pinea TaxID=933095 RepID=A0AAI8VAC6_9PEZI|nr:Uu.00g113610.m01.CDS01 [Anthostomella pinea]
MSPAPERLQSSSMSAPPDASASPAASGAPPVKRRAPIACRSVFPSRGDSDADRLFRHPRQRADRRSRGEIIKVKSEAPVSPGFVHNALSNAEPPKLADEWDLLPSLDIVIDGIDTFTRHFYQLGFIHKKMFMQTLRETPETLSVFLLLSMLCIAARFNDSFIKMYGDGLQAVTELMQNAQRMALKELYLEPTLERCQAFYILSIAEQGSGKSNTSYISSGIAFRMAALMRLHREEAYSPITADSPIAHRIRAESARRTFWMLHSQDNLHSGPYKPVSIAASDITALLPSDEADFEAGRIPAQRAALEGTPPAIQDPNLVSLKPRPLFASLMQVHNFWGVIARRILCNEKDWQPNDEDSDFAKLDRRLNDWERNLPSEHAFGKILLGGYRHYAEDLAYLSCTGTLRLCHIVLRKAYLDEMIRHAHRNPADPEAKFYQNMAADLFCNVRLLHEQLDAHFEDGTPVESLGSQMAAFVTYSCGLLASYLCKFPQLDAQHVGNNLQAAQAEGRMMYLRSLGILRAYQHIWPLAETWCNGLEKWFKDSNPKRISFQAGTMTDGKEPQPYALGAMHPRVTTPACHTAGVNKKFHTARSKTQQRSTAEKAEAPRLAPLQNTQSNYVEPVCLPPLSQAQYAAHNPQPQPQPTPSQAQPRARSQAQNHTRSQSQSQSQAQAQAQAQAHPPQQPQPQPQQSQQHYQPQQPQTVYPNSGLEMLIEASAHQTPPAAMDAYNPHAFYVDQGAAAEYALNDGFDSNLQVLVDGGAQWTATDATTAIYSPYGYGNICG